jgi:Glucose / Sorbosone dehydrogenase
MCLPIGPNPAPCSSLTFDPLEFPPSVPIQKESAWSHRDFRPPLKTFFTVGNDYDFRVRGPATIAPSGLDIYTKDVIPDWVNSLLLVSLKGTLYRLKLSSDGLSIQGDALEYFKSMNRYRDIALNPDGRTIYISTDEGTILEFSYRPQ